MAQEIVPGIYQLALPLTDSPLGTVNAYLVADEVGINLVDCGWDTPEAYEALRGELLSLGANISDLREIVLTHIHPDHFGLAERLQKESGASIGLHPIEAGHLHARYEDTVALVAEMNAWLRVNGVPPRELAPMTEGSLEMLQRVGRLRPDRLLGGGEELMWGAYRFEVVWTPGHSGGLLCLYARAAEVLISSDHVLERISPHVGLHTQSLGNPLQDYLASLALVRELPVQVVLPGHGAPFTDLAGRVDAIVQHHERRFAEMNVVLGRKEMTAYEVATQLSWRGSESGWQRLEPFQRRMAVTETIAHLELLHTRGELGKRFSGGVIHFQHA